MQPLIEEPYKFNEIMKFIAKIPGLPNMVSKVNHNTPAELSFSKGL